MILKIQLVSSKNGQKEEVHEIASLNRESLTAETLGLTLSEGK